MRDYLSIGPAPADEPCVQVGDENYMGRSRVECARFIEAIRATCGVEPSGARLKIKAFPHDFGAYLEVVCEFDTDDEASMSYAFRVEAEAPARWPAEGESHG